MTYQVIIDGIDCPSSVPRYQPQNFFSHHGPSTIPRSTTSSRPIRNAIECTICPPISTSSCSSTFYSFDPLRASLHSDFLLNSNSHRFHLFSRFTSSAKGSSTRRVGSYYIVGTGGRSEKKDESEYCSS